MKLTDKQKRLIAASVTTRIEKLETVIAEWDALPDDAIVDNLTRYVVGTAKEDLPQLKELARQMSAGW